VNTAFGLGLMALLAYIGLHYAVYTSAGYAAAFCTSYVLNARYTFEKPLSAGQFAAFVSMNGLLLLVTQGLHFVLIDLIGIRELFGVIIGAVFYTLVGYLLNSRFVYHVGELKGFPAR